VSIKIAHVSDIHVRKLKYHKEYRVVFQRLYEKLRELKPDIIVNTGDTFHTKLDLSPEAIRMMSELFAKLADIAPYYMILGNHDMNLKNGARLDAITPIVENLKHPNLHFIKNTETIEVAEGIDLRVLSIVDPENWPETLPDDRVNIALYHGSIAGSTTDTGWVMTHGDINIETLTKYDYGLLGDIHKTHQKIDNDGKCAYPGSLIQQNHGETPDKGFLLWEIEDKDTFTCKHHQIENPKPFITIQLTPKGKMPRRADPPKGARLRLVSNNNLPLSTMKRAIDIAKHRFKPEVVTFLNRAAGERGNVEDITDTLKTENLRDIDVQEELMDEYLKDYQADASTIEMVYELNRKYKKQVEDTEEISRNVNWKLSNFEFDNLFNYGEDNSVSFDKLNGIVGIFGKNYSGKSSIVDGLLWTVFNTTSKNERKNVNVINQNRPSCRGKVTIEVGHNIYTIERTAEKYTKKLKGEVTEEAKTDLNFEVLDKTTDEVRSLNGLSRPQTDANIRKHFGTIDDFLVSSLASQHGALAFIDEGSTRRKEIIAKFLDLEVFEQKFKLAKEDSSDLKGALKRLESREYEEEVKEATEELESMREALSIHEGTCEELDQEIIQLTADCVKLNDMIESIPAEIIDIVATRKEIKQKQARVKSLTSENKKSDIDLGVKNGLYEKVEKFIAGVDINTLTETQNNINKLEGDKQTHEHNRAILITEIGDIEKKSHLLDDIPCGTQFSTCKFISDANVAVANLLHVENDRDDISKNIKEIENDISDLGPIEVARQIDQHTLIVEKRNDIANDIASINLSIERNTSSIERIGYELKELESKKQEYDENKEAIENLEELNVELGACEKNLTSARLQCTECREQTLELYKSVGSLEQKVETIESQKQEYIDLQEEYSAYDLYMRCMHTSGIAYDIIKRKLPVINQEVAKVLANIVEFEVFFEDSGKKFDIFIKHPRHEPRPIEMASGAEKSLAAIAIRLALLGVSSLPKSDLFALDEPGTALDEENMEGFIRILELIKVYFKNVLLISHLDSLKDCVDMQIVIEKKSGYAKVNQ
jgi:DNA repair exonuclease SbcCD ATPase subunit/DNA repair exonuclease SbcCD nuclease subunit